MGYIIYTRNGKGHRWYVTHHVKHGTVETARDAASKTIKYTNRPGMQAKAVDEDSGRMVRGSLYTNPEVK